MHFTKKKYKVPADISVMGCDNTLFAKMHKVSLTTIEHFVVFKGRDACDIIMKKILSQNSQYSEIQPISTYHVEYEPRLIVRGTTSYAKTKKGKISLNSKKLVIFHSLCLRKRYKIKNYPKTVSKITNKIVNINAKNY